MNKNFIPDSSGHEDIDQLETQEWSDALQAVIENEGNERAHYLIERLLEQARQSGSDIPFSANTNYVNTIAVDQQANFPGDTTLEHKIRSYVRWNAMIMVLRANINTNVGGHIASFASAATLYDVGYNHFWHAPSDNHGGDLVFFQGHSSPGSYARAFMLGRLSEAQMDKFRQEVDGDGLSSYPHPWLMPNFWQFPTVSMGLGPIMAIYQARFMRYMQDRGFAKTEGRKIWAFLGDGETDEPESLGAISMAGREKLDNLIFVVNCNLQRLDGPVRGNGKIIQELEGAFCGAGWNVIKLIWGNHWDILLACDRDGHLARRMMSCVDGDYQTFKAKDGAYVRKHFFNTPELKAMVASWSDQDVWELNRGGHDPIKIYAAYHAAINHIGQPTVILAKTVKGYGMGESGEAQNISHQQKKMSMLALKRFSSRFDLPVSQEDIANLKYLKFDEDAPAMKYMREHREKLGGYLPARRSKSETLIAPPLTDFKALLQGSGEKEISTTVAFLRILNILVKNKQLGKRIVPIIPDESRTFGMEGMFRQLGIWSHQGQNYTPQDAGQLMFYKEDKEGQVLQEGINEAGGMSDWIAAGTSYAIHNVAMIPFYIFYSMFGFQRIGDLIWAAADQRCRGFLLGGTAGRTTLNGEGLQHEDGHSQVIAATVPNCLSYDPTFSFELAVIIQDGLRRMYAEQEDVFYYITVMNENYHHPIMPKNIEQNILKGMYLFRKGNTNKKEPHVALLGSGTIYREAIIAADLLKNDWNITADLWSCPSFNELAREGNQCKRWNRLHPADTPKQSHVEKCLPVANVPVVAATDYVRAFADQIRPFIVAPYTVLGTDGFGRSDTRKNLRRFFEVDCYHIVVAALKGLADINSIDSSKVLAAIAKYNINTELDEPRLR